MSERISGLSIGLDVESAGIERSLNQIKNSFREVKRSAQTNINNLKFDTRSVDGYKKNLDQLTDAYSIQEQNVKGLKRELDKLEATNKSGTQEAQNLRNEYNKQVDELNRLGREADEAREAIHQMNVENSGFTQLGNAMNTAGDNLQSFGGQLQSVGGSMTKWITAPILGVISAAGGMTAAFGWSRLVGLDSAKAQLEGLGYSAQEVESITGEVSDAIQGGMMTMAEGTSTAAGAMAAGVEQGEELERYLKLVDAAAVGANRPVGEMATIFNRVQGSGKLMTQELNQIEDGMPGFSLAMAEHMGVGLEEFRKMVSEGQIQTDDFLDVMEDFAGGMAEAQADSWQGMVQNTKAWIGILGENLLSGVFEQSKESLNDFLALLSSEEAQEWAADMGKTISETFSTVVENVRSGVEWFMKLGKEKHKLIGIIGAVAVAAGPLLMALGSMSIFIGGAIKAIAPLFMWLGRISGGIKTVTMGIKPLAAVFGTLNLPVTLAVSAIAALGAGFVLAYRRSETFRDFIAGLGDMFKGAWETAMQLKDNLVTAFQGIFAIFSGDRAGGIQLLQSLGLDEGTIQTILSTINTIQINFHKMRIYIGQAFNAVREVVMTVLDAVVGFVQEKISQIVAFWQTDGQQILQAVKNIFSGISTAISATLNFIMPIIQSALNGILNIFKVVRPAVLFVVQMVWENIKGVINGGLNIIKGLVQVFSGIFTGDFSKMWEGVKNIFSGAIQFVWNLFQLMFWGRIIRGITSFIRGGIALFRNFGTQTGTVFTNMWQAVVRIFTNLWQGAMRIFNNMRTGLTNTVQNINTGINNIISRMVSAVLNFFRNLFTRGVQIFNNLRTSLTNTTNNIRTGISNTISNLVSSVLRFFRNLLSNALNIFNNMRTGLTNRIQAVRDNVVNAVTRMRDRALNIYRDLKDKAAGFLTDMVDGAKKLPGRIGDGIKNMASKAVDGIKSLGNSMLGKLGEVVNSVISGLNNITGKLGITATIDKWNVPTFSRGTMNGRIAQDTLATVGDRGPGNGSGTRELVQYPNGTAGLYDNDATIFAPRGTVIWNNRQTEEILAKNPQFSRGTVGGSGTDQKPKKEKKKGLLGTLSDVVSNVWDYVTNPGKALQAVIDNVAPDFSGLKGFAGTIIKGGFNFIKDKALDWLTGIFESSGNVDGSHILGKRILQTFGRYTGNIGFNGGKHYGIDTAHKFDPLISPTDGKVSRIWNDYGGGKSLQVTSDKYIWWFMHLSSIMKKVGDMVKAGMRLGTTGNSGNFVVGSGHLHTQVHPKSKGAGNHNAIDPLPILKGTNSHLLGGLALTDGLFNLHGGEYIINPNKPTEAMKLLAIVGKKLAGKSKQTRELPNPGRSGNDNSVMERLLEKTIEQNQILMQILKKDTDVILDGDSVKEKMDERDYNDDLRRRLFSGKKRGVTAT